MRRCTTVARNRPAADVCRGGPNAVFRDSAVKAYHFVWLIWASLFLIPWSALFIANPARRSVIWRTSLATAVTGVAEPLFVPAYWNPPSLFDLAQRTGFDIESIIFAFAVGGIGAVLYNTVTRRTLASVPGSNRSRRRHGLHRAALLIPYAVFVPLYLLPWNPIYAAIASLFIGAAASALCRPDLARKAVIGGMLFLGLYGAFMLGLQIFAPGYIAQVWKLSALSGVLVDGIPLEELLFGFSFGMYWTGIYEHFTWRRTTHLTSVPIRW